MTPKRKGVYRSIDTIAALNKKLRELFLFISLAIFSGALFIKMHDIQSKYLEITVLGMLNYTYIAIISLLGFVFVVCIYFSYIKMTEAYSIRRNLVSQTHVIKAQLQDTINNMNEIFEKMAHN